MEQNKQCFLYFIYLYCYRFGFLHLGFFIGLCLGIMLVSLRVTEDVIYHKKISECGQKEFVGEIKESKIIYNAVRKERVLKNSTRKSKARL